MKKYLPILILVTISILSKANQINTHANSTNIQHQAQTSQQVKNDIEAKSKEIQENINIIKDSTQQLSRVVDKMDSFKTEVNNTINKYSSQETKQQFKQFAITVAQLLLYSLSLQQPFFLLLCGVLD